MKVADYMPLESRAAKAKGGVRPASTYRAARRAMAKLAYRKAKRFR